MERYLNIMLVQGEKIINEAHDLYIDLCEKATKKVQEIASELGAALLIYEVESDRAECGSYILAEHNFEMPREKKEEIIECLKPFFMDWEFKKGGPITKSNLSYARFLKTEGELFTIK